MFRCLAAALALAAFVASAAPPDVAAKSVSVTSGDIRAELDYEPSRDGGTGPVQLTIFRADIEIGGGSVDPVACGDFGCIPMGSPGSATGALRLADLEGDDRPEAIVSLYTMGAHCCTVVQVWRIGADTAEPALERNFGNVGFRLGDIDDDGAAEFVSADDRFAYRYASYASSARPIRILRFARGGLRDVTSDHRGRVLRDQRRWWRIYKGRPYESRGIIAAWAADGYRLGRRLRTLRVLRREARRGRLTVGRSSGVRFVRRLDRDLLRLGYR